MDDTIHVLVKEVNSRKISVYQEKIEEESRTLQTEGETIEKTITVKP